MPPRPKPFFTIVEPVPPKVGDGTKSTVPPVRRVVSQPPPAPAKLDLTKFYVTLDDFKRCADIGRGGQGYVVKYECKVNGQRYKAGDLVAVNAELTELHKLNESLSADLNKVTLVSQGYEAEVAEQSNELKTLQAKVMKLEATLEAEKTISESLKGTIDTLTGAMAGGGTGKSKQPRSRKTS